MESKKTLMNCLTDGGHLERGIQSSGSNVSRGGLAGINLDEEEQRVCGENF